MKVAIVYNRESRNVINLFGLPNQEKIGKATIGRLKAALQAGGHQVKAFEGDKDLIGRLEDFMPRALKGERPGLVFNVSYGIQGSARYTHVPGILEMVGVPYVGSDPLAHSLALDKVVTKMILREHGLPTPDFAVLAEPGFPDPEIEYPVIVKPKNEAVSFGIRVCHNVEELREGAQVIFERFGQAVLVERYIAGREVNVGILGNNPARALPPAELDFGDGEKIYTYEDKTRKSGREVGVVCPAPLGEELTARAQDLAVRAFQAIGCRDCARVDMRLDDDGAFYILEINSLPSLGEHGSYTHAAAADGLDFPGLCNKLVDVAALRYFDVVPPSLSAPDADLLEAVTNARDSMEKRVKQLVDMSSRTGDMTGCRLVAENVAKRLSDAGLRRNARFDDGVTTWFYETPKGADGGTVLVCPVDVPRPADAPPAPFVRAPEWLQGEGIASSRAPLVVVETALSIARANKALRGKGIGVVLYADEGHGAETSRRHLERIFARAARVLVMSPGPDGGLVARAPGWRTCRLVVDAPPRRPGDKGATAFARFTSALDEARVRAGAMEGCALCVVGLRTHAHPRMAPHRLEASVVVTSKSPRDADHAVEALLESLRAKKLRARITTEPERPALPRRNGNAALVAELGRLGARWDLPTKQAATKLACIGGLAPPGTAVAAGLGPDARGIDRPEEAVSRLTLTQRTLLLAAYLCEGA